MKFLGNDNELVREWKKKKNTIKSALFSTKFKFFITFILQSFY